MIDRTQHPEAWAFFMTELDDAREHLSHLIESLHGAGSVDTAELGVDLGHVFAHLNRAWYQHRHQADLPENEWVEASSFPNDLRPVG